MPVPSGFDAAQSPAEMARLIGDLLADCSDWTDAELADGVVALDRLRSQVDAAAAIATARWDGRTVWAGDGAQSGAGWLNAHGELTTVAARSLIKRGRDLRQCPEVTGAYQQGLIGTAKVRLLLEARKDVEKLFAEHEADLVEHIRPLTVEHAAIALRHWRKLAKPGDDGPEPADTTDSLTLVPTLDGRWDLQGDLDAVTGKVIANAIEGEIDTMFKRGQAHPDDGLTYRQRQAAALAELVRRGAGFTTKHGQARPLVHVVVDAATLRGDLLDDITQTLYRRCELTGRGAGPIPVATAQRFICEGHVAAIVTRRNPDGTYDILDASPATRTATRRQRRALRERDGGCAFPGCDAPVEWCDAHHVVPFEVGGPTVMDNLVLVCRFHHHQVHEGGFRLTRPEGCVTVHRPDGTLLATATPHGHQPPLEPTQPSNPSPATRPRSRFRPLAERLTEEEREIRWCRQRALDRLYNGDPPLVIPDLP